jgi:hypothetical protein
MDNGAAILEALQRIERKLDVLLVKKSRRPRQAQADDELLARLLPVVTMGMGKDGRQFATKDALRFLQGNDPGAFKAALRQLGVNGQDPARRLGKMLSRAAATGRVIDGMLIERIGDDRNASLWKAKSVSCAPETHQTDLAA